ncbi:MAG: leucine-rich repeat domain-containing protein [Prevotella sp.]|jgi:hypothetical protein|nr:MULTISPECIES: leucine-rich repeat domain-containing protein [unclassified Prevotella]MCH3970179.1 leucine-rich repeat domain-containing protein [Prevotella sp.]MCH3992460.1 leucine-rich repeat domain-containing protein [Prevotella sp.]MCH4016940.1 leucine-rich repeat domain-containing protein [Prevotella sp.]MCH4099016.1 leucine-rich repeat domain-containing protein [Prevotella sp.]MCH4186230.1 leucine-rich repeat domain-containing protein [Prevotella sp.]
MKENKKAILEILQKNSKKNSKFDELVLNLALQKISGEHFEYDDQAVYSADHKRMIYCLYEGENFEIPEGVEIIGQKAFYKKKNLRHVTIPSSVISIEKDAFTGCDSLEMVNLPASVERIESFAFSDCGTLKTVNFEGVPKHLSRHSFEESERLANIIVPSGTVKKFRKALHFDDGDMDYIVVDRDIVEADAADGLKKKADRAKLNKEDHLKSSDEKEKSPGNLSGKKKKKGKD